MDLRAWTLCTLLSFGCGGYVGSTTPSAGDSGEAPPPATGGEDDEDEDAGTDDFDDEADALDGGSRPEAGPRDAAAQRDAAARDGSASDAQQDAGQAPSPGQSAGCGMAASGEGTFVEQNVRVGGVDRRYHVRLPDDYDPARPYPLIFRFHGYGGNGLSGGLGIEGPAAADAIIIGPDGLNQGWSNGSEAGDLAFFDAMYEAATQRYCVDLGRVFSYGFSMGGGFTNLLGCRRAELLRATAAIAGFDRGTGTCTRPVAAWFQHDRGDEAVAFSQGTSARDRVLERAGCSMQTTPDGSCVRYQGCDPDYPVVWCETTGRGHDIAGGTAPAAVWDFFRTLP